MSVERDFFTEEDIGWVACCVAPWQATVKRMLDLVVSFALLLVFAPFLPLIACLIRMSSQGPVFFRQERIGQLGKPFLIYKFRTMTENAVSLGGFETNPSDPRITPMGKFLRTWTLDELPQLWNVVRGEMSLVGPRPTLAYQVEAYTATQRRRLLVKPGMTGLAQVSGRNRIDWARRIELDLQYIQNFSLRRDLKILWATLGVIFFREGVYQ